MANFSEVVDYTYSCPNSINLRIDFEDGVAYDYDNDRVIFRMEQYFSLRRRRVLVDASSDESICILHKKKITMHGRWEVHKGDPSQLSFIVKKSDRVSSKEHIDLDVFLPNNTEESFCKIKANQKRKSCEIYARGSTLADGKAIIENKNAMKIKIGANVDHAFIMALLMIVDVKYKKKSKKVWKGIMTATSEAVGVAGLVVGITTST